MKSFECILHFNDKLSKKAIHRNIRRLGKRNVSPIYKKCRIFSERELISMKRNIMGIPFTNITKKELLDEQLAPRLETEQKTFVVTANPEIVMKTRENPTYKKVVQQADFIAPDGIGIIYAAKMMRQPLKERIPGIEIVDDLLHLAEEKGYSCYFLGAAQAVNEQAVARIRESFPNLQVAGNHHGFFDSDDATLAEEIASVQPDIVLIATGAPKQEYWISTYKHLFAKGLFMGVGGSFDVYAGTVKRAPKLWMKLNLEWLYRIVIQPTRIKRIFTSFRFMFLVAIGRGRK